MKKLKTTSWFLIVILALTPLLSSCHNNTDNAKSAGKLTIYYYSSLFYDQAITNLFLPTGKVTPVAFDNAEEMDKRIATETGSGKGADVFLFVADNTTLDTQKMAKNGAFLRSQQIFQKFQ
jgi:ABC-type glycerol-3-phosphate transport system substrate-binding protein